MSGASSGTTKIGDNSDEEALTMQDVNDVVDSEAFKTHENPTEALTLVKQKDIAFVAHTESIRSGRLYYLKDMGLHFYLRYWQAHVREVWTENNESFDAILTESSLAPSWSCISAQ